jgi:hypothetical protein
MKDLIELITEAYSYCIAVYNLGNEKGIKNMTEKRMKELMGEKNAVGN